MKQLYLVLFLTSLQCFSQRVTSHYLQLHQYNFPTHPLPNTCEVYGVQTKLSGRSIITYDYRGDKLVVHDLGTQRFGYNPGNDGLIPKLFAFKRHTNGNVPYEKGFIIKAETDDVEIYHKFSSIEKRYNLVSKGQLRIEISHQNKVIVQDTVSFSEKVGEFTSELSEEDIHIIATNKINELGPSLNDNILKSTISTFNALVKASVDLSFRRDYIKFYGLTKLKKFSNPQQLNDIEIAIKSLEKLDENLLDRSSFTSQVNGLIGLFLDLTLTKDYKENTSFQLFVQANLGSLFTLTTDYDNASIHYKKALDLTDKYRIQLVLERALQNASFLSEQKAKLFSKNNNGFNAAYSKKLPESLPI